MRELLQRVVFHTQHPRSAKSAVSRASRGTLAVTAGAAAISPAPRKRDAEASDAAQVALLERRVREVALETGAALHKLSELRFVQSQWSRRTGPSAPGHSPLSPKTMREEAREGSETE